MFGIFQSLPTQTDAGMRSAGVTHNSLLTVVVMLIGLAAGDVNAREQEELQQGTLIMHAPDGSEVMSLPVSTKVRMQVSGLINRVWVEQTFRNGSEFWLDGRYLFPLPENAAVDGMELKIGERKIQGQVKTRGQAKADYEKARAEGKKASLVEQHRPNKFFSTRVANLAPGEAVQVSIHYQQTLSYDNGRFSLRFPMLVAPRYQSPSGEPETDLISAYGAGQQAETDNSGKQGGASPGTVDIQAVFHGAGALGQILSPHHWVTVSPGSEDSLEVTLLDALPNRDFVLEWQMADPGRPQAVSYMQSGMSHVPSDTSVAELEQNTEYGVVMLVPPVTGNHEFNQGRELVLVIDVSGSMGGESIRQARQALERALTTLSSADRFNILAFSDRVTSFSAASIPATKNNLHRAYRFVDSLEADGGTEMAPALLQALKVTEDKTGLRQVIFITDGAVGNERQLFELIRNHLGDSRLFTVGIGSAPNSFFMEKAARSGKGTFTYIGSEQQVAERMTELLDKIASPVMTNLQLRYADGTVPEYWPANLPDLYAGEPIMVSLRQQAGRSDELIVSGDTGALDARKQFWQTSIDLGRQVKSRVAGLDLLWAREQMAELRFNETGTNHPRVKEQITALALKYHLISPYTSLVAIDVTPDKPVDAESRLAEARLMRPAGWSGGASGQVMPKTATGSPGELLAGLILMLTGLSGYYLVSRKRMLKA
ncbi:marine proteobacterial sortase target protein [Shewanella corallii]|uniref:Marine proteobacterial sortase target protein n=1 Tax=Shewanella corallii TaxID=560080 RepID=A0ABT0N8J4_9GAMM|nr:marine proteobacterial sortase target protein [Shewanella corallii]MCL2914719.1 marine proteobacterial sortase target protein [Shewanella corallii]